MGTEDVDAKDAISPGIGKDFDGAFQLAEGAGARVRAKGEDAFSILDARFLQLLFGFPYSTDFRLGIDDCRNCVIVHVAIAGCQILRTSDALLLGFVRQHRPRDDVANSVNAAGARGEAFVDLNPPLSIQLYARVFQPEVI